MMTTLADLIAQLQADVPAVNGTPSEAQYEQAVKDAVWDFSRLCGRVKFGELNIISGTANYALADDFMDLIMLESPSGADGVIISSTGLIPVSANWQEAYYIHNKQITFKPTPAYTMTREYKYKAAWIMDDEEEYTEMGDDEARIVMIKARQLAIEKIAKSIASSGTMQYSLGAVSVSKSGGVSELTKMLFALHAEFKNACDSYNGAAVGAF